MQAVVVADGGQFESSFSGVQYERLTSYFPHVPNQPDNRLVSYAGRYAGLSSINAARSDVILPVPPGTDPALIPGQASRVSRKVFIGADFTDNWVNGAIYDRRNVDLGTDLAEETLSPTKINEDGTFQGTATGGEYSGAFGGTGATTVAGGASSFLPAAV